MQAQPGPEKAHESVRQEDRADAVTGKLNGKRFSRAPLFCNVAVTMSE